MVHHNRIISMFCISVSLFFIASCGTSLSHEAEQLRVYVEKGDPVGAIIAWNEWYYGCNSVSRRSWIADDPYAYYWAGKAYEISSMPVEAAQSYFHVFRLNPDVLEQYDVTGEIFKDAIEVLIWKMDFAGARNALEQYQTIVGSVANADSIEQIIDDADRSYQLESLVVAGRRACEGFWEICRSGTYENLNSISFCNSRNGLIVGDNGTIIRTVDGGSTWIPVDSRSSEDLLDVLILTPDIALAVGRRSEILCTFDGGVTWLGAGRNLNSGFFQECVYAGDQFEIWGFQDVYDNDSRIACKYYSIDFEHWSGPMLTGNSGIEAISISPNRRWSLYNNTICRFLSTLGGIVTDLFYADDQINDICFYTDESGWAVGNEGFIEYIYLRYNSTMEAHGIILKCPVLCNLNGVCSTSPDNTWAVGDQGTILRFIQTSKSSKLFNPVLSERED